MGKLVDAIRQNGSRPYTPTRRAADANRPRIAADRNLEAELIIAKVSALHLEGQGEAAICRNLGLTEGQCREYMSILRHRWAAISLQDIDQSIRTELAKLAHLEAEHWSAWERSKAVELPLVERQRLQKQYGVRVEVTGDVAFLDGVMKCIDRRIRLLGLDAPIKIDIEAKVRMMAEAAGLDPDLAVEEAKRVIAEARNGLQQRLDRG